MILMSTEDFAYLSNSYLSGKLFSPPPPPWYSYPARVSIRICLEKRLSTFCVPPPWIHTTRTECNPVSFAFVEGTFVFKGGLGSSPRQIAFVTPERSVDKGEGRRYREERELWKKKVKDRVYCRLREWIFAQPLFDCIDYFLVGLKAGCVSVLCRCIALLILFALPLS